MRSGLVHDYISSNGFNRKIIFIARIRIRLNGHLYFEKILFRWLLNIVWYPWWLHIRLRIGLHACIVSILFYSIIKWIKQSTLFLSTFLIFTITFQEAQWKKFWTWKKSFYAKYTPNCTKSFSIRGTDIKVHPEFKLSGLLHWKFPPVYSVL